MILWKHSVASRTRSTVNDSSLDTSSRAVGVQTKASDPSGAEQHNDSETVE